MRRYEVAIIGGGPAGLSAALVLARACRSVAVVDAGTPRNSASPGVHSFLSRDGTLPADLRKLSRAQIAIYPGAEFVDQGARYVFAAGRGPGFDITLNDGEALHADIVILAVGMIDTLPEIAGFDRHWGREVIHCPFCHGFENRNTRWGVLARGLEDVAKAEDYRFWSDNLTVFADPRMHIPRALEERLAGSDIRVVRGSVTRLDAAEDGGLRAVGLDDGSQVPCETVVYRPSQQQTRVVVDSGVALTESGRVWIDETSQTSIPGIFAAGDLTPGCQDALSAAAEGASVAKNALDLLAA